MTILRLVADDLTGALDAGAQFTGALGLLPCTLGPVQSWPTGRSVAVNLACRDGRETDAVAATETSLAVFDGADIAFKKIDSLLRGHWAAELAVCIRSERFATVVLAPAFPAQNRRTRRGRQWARHPGAEWTMIDVDPERALGRWGVSSRLIDAGTDLTLPPRARVLICDADSDDDLERIATLAPRLPQPVLWCGTAGLAQALAGAAPQRLDPGGTPHLAVVGTNNRVSLEQVARLKTLAPERVVTFDHDAAASAARIASALERFGRVLATPDLPPSIDGTEAASRIARWLGDVFGRLPPPAVLTASGGETFLALCRGLLVDHLCLEGEWAPGLPISRLVGGPWNGVTALSKSGAFGDADLYVRLLAADL